MYEMCGREQNHGMSSRRVPPQAYFAGSAVFHYLGPAFAVLQVHEVHPDPAVAYQYMARGRDRVGLLDDGEFVRAAVS